MTAKIVKEFNHLIFQNTQKEQFEDRHQGTPDKLLILKDKMKVLDFDKNMIGRNKKSKITTE